MAKKRGEKALLINGETGESEKAAVARTVLGPTLHGAFTVQQYGKWFPLDLDLNELMNALSNQTKIVIDDACYLIPKCRKLYG